MTLGELVDSSARPVNVILHSCYQPVSFVFILLTFPRVETLSRPSSVHGLYILSKWR